MKSEALKELETRHQAMNKRRYPNIPDHCRPKIKFTDTTANGLTKAILTWLELNGHKAWRQSSEGRYRPGKEYTDVLGHRKQLPGQYLPGTNRGHADIASIIDGRFAAWEIKMNDRQSKEQSQFQSEVEKAGGKYFIVHSFDEFMNYYKQLSNQLPL